MYEHIIREFNLTPWAILESKLAEIRAFLCLKAAGGTVVEPRAAVVRKPAVVANAVAVLPLLGVISQRMNLLVEYSGGTSTDLLLRDFRQVRDDSSIKAIVFDCDTPGGGVPGLPEFWQEVFDSRGSKPILFVVNSLCASAGYWMASAGGEIVATPGGEGGSIGVFAEHIDYSEMERAAGIKVTTVRAKISPRKAEFTPSEPLSEDAHAELQRSCDMYGEMFVDFVARGRGISTKAVRSDFGQGRCLSSKAGLTAKMFDRIASLDATLRKLLGTAGAKGAARAEALPTESLHATADEAPALVEPQPPLYDAAEMRRRELELRLMELGSAG